MQKAFDVSKVRSLTTSNAAGRAIFDALGKRERSTKELDIRRLYRSLVSNNINLSKNEVADVFRHLQQYGVGHVITGRRGKPMRFHWHVKLLDVVDALKQETVETDLKNDEQQPEIPGTIVIRKGSVELEVPADLSDSGLLKLVKVIERIPN